MNVRLVPATVTLSGPWPFEIDVGLPAGIATPGVGVNAVRPPAPFAVSMSTVPVATCPFEPSPN